MLNHSPEVVKTRIAVLVAYHCNVKLEDLKPDSRVLQFADSLSRVDLILDLEDEYDINLNDSAVDANTTYAAIENLVVSKVIAQHG